MVEYRFEPHFLDLLAFFEPYSEVIWVNGKYKAEELEPLIEDIFVHETIHSVLIKLESWLVCRRFDCSKAVLLKECGGKE